MKIEDLFKQCAEEFGPRGYTVRLRNDATLKRTEITTRKKFEINGKPIEYGLGFSDRDPLLQELGMEYIRERVEAAERDAAEKNAN